MEHCVEGATIVQSRREKLMESRKQAIVRPEIEVRTVYSSPLASGRLRCTIRLCKWLRGLQKEPDMGHKVTATERVDRTDFRLTLEKGPDGHYFEIDRKPLPMGLPARAARWLFRPVRWMFRMLFRVLGWPFRVVHGVLSNIVCWVEEMWAETNPVVLATSFASLPSYEQLRNAGLDKDAIARLRKSPHSFPNVLRRFGFDFGHVRGIGLARVVGAVHFILR